MSAIRDEWLRRAVLDLLAAIGGEHNHAEIAYLLNESGQIVAHRDVACAMLWLGDNHLIICQRLGRFEVGRILDDGRDVANDKLIVEGVSKFRTSE